MYRLSEYKNYYYFYGEEYCQERIPIRRIKENFYSAVTSP